MATKICVVSQLPLDRQVTRVKLPVKADGTNWKQGELVVAETLVTGERTTYDGKEVSLATDKPVIIINQDVYKDAYGNRIDGMVSPSVIELHAGQVIKTIRPEVNTLFELSYDCVGGTPVIGSYLVVDETTKALKVVSAITTEKYAFKIEATEYEGHGNNFVQMMIVRTVIA